MNDKDCIYHCFLVNLVMSIIKLMYISQQNTHVLMIYSEKECLHLSIIAVEL